MWIQTLGLSTVLIQIANSSTILASAAPSVHSHSCSLELHRYKTIGLSKLLDNTVPFTVNHNFVRQCEGTFHPIRPLGILTWRFKGIVTFFSLGTILVSGTHSCITGPGPTVSGSKKSCFDLGKNYTAPPTSSNPSSPDLPEKWRNLCSGNLLQFPL